MTRADVSAWPGKSSSSISVRIAPGATALTVIPVGPISRASDRVKPTTAPFDET